MKETQIELTVSSVLTVSTTGVAPQASIPKSLATAVLVSTPRNTTLHAKAIFVYFPIFFSLLLCFIS
ncbi:MAG: hypothetical protein Q3X95_06560, partial [Duodenibacillus sp.]|nr:hypothetical protein [Duodenibacillus sp.]